MTERGKRASYGKMDLETFVRASLSIFWVQMVLFLSKRDLDEQPSAPSFLFGRSKKHILVVKPSG